jgi:hypothetical protein
LLLVSAYVATRKKSLLDELIYPTHECHLLTDSPHIFGNLSLLNRYLSVYLILLSLAVTHTFLGIDALKHSFPGPMDTWMMTWPILGPMFMAAGLSHFSMKDGANNSGD